MLRLAKGIFWLAILGFGVQSASAFALLGPLGGTGTARPDGYQQAIIGYQLPGDIGTPKNFGEEFRRNTPVMYYTFDANFLEYFGTDGSNAIVQAFEMMNTLTNVSSYSGNLDEFPMAVQEYNYQAQALLLQDLKSITMNLLVEQLGLAEPDRWTWTLRDRVVGPAPGCPTVMLYTIVKRNFDPVWSLTDQLQTSSYVNGTLYTYYIFEFCVPPNPIAEAVEAPADPLAGVFNAVASLPADFGGFFTGLTRDDVGGLRYLYRTNNLNIESAGPDTLTFVTNTAPQLLSTSNLTLFTQQALTNDAAALNALYPNLVITGTTPIFTNIITTNIISYFANYPLDPVNTPAHLVTVTVLTTNVETFFNHTFANARIIIRTNADLGASILPLTSIADVLSFTNGPVFLLITNISTTACAPAAPFGSICTNVSISAIPASFVRGDFFIIPSNFCEVSIISTQLIQTVFVTNLLAVATNAPATTNVGVQEFSVSLVYSYNQYVFVIRPVICPSNSVALRQGVERISFVRRDFDSLLNRFFYPITNSYTLFAITNNTLIPQRVERVVLAPDFLITAADIGETDPGNGVAPAAGVGRDITFDTTNVAAFYPALAGPGTISRGGIFGAGTTFTYDKKGPHYENQFSSFFFGTSFITSSEASQTQFFAWGSFDGTTNLPVVYPNGTSITNLENSVLIQVIAPGSFVVNGVVHLPNGTVGVDYTTVFGGFTVIGGLPPYSWTMAPGSPALPPDLVLNPNGTISGAPTPDTAGLTFDFVIRMTDAGSRFVDRAYAITINP